MCSTTLMEQSAGDEAQPVPLDLLERQICEGAADLAAAMCRWLELLAEFDERGGWRVYGVNSCAHWLSWRCGIGLRTAQEHVRVARSIVDLPLVFTHFASGELSYTKVRAITRVAQPATESQLVEWARHATGAQLDKIVRGYAGVIRVSRSQAAAAEVKQGLHLIWDDEGMLQVQGRLTPENGCILRDALQAADPGDWSEVHSSRLVAALMAIVQGTAPARAELVVHVDAETLSREEIVDRCEVEDGPSIAPELARRLGCDATLQTMVERDGTPLAVGRRTRVINPALRRALQSRDEGCRFPGCTNTRYLHAHHVEHWARGGRTDLANLIQLCSQHHHLVHEGGFRVTSQDGEVRFYSERGWEIPTMVEPLRMSEMSVGAENHAAGIVIDADTCRPLSGGDSCDYDIAVGWLAHAWLPPPAPD